MDKESAEKIFKEIELKLQKLCIAAINNGGTLNTAQTIKEFTDERYASFKSYILKRIEPKEK